MRSKGAAAIAALLAVVALGAGLVTSAGAGSDSKKVLRIGWAQGPETLNPFVDGDLADYQVWGLNWRLPIGFDPANLKPIPSVVAKWKTSKDGLTTTFTLKEGMKWSDGEPITSADVKYTLDVLGGNGLYFTTYTSNVASVKAPDAGTVVIKTTVPDTRIVGGLFLYVLPEHIWGKVPVKKLTGDFTPSFPMVGSGPWVVTKFDRERLIKMERNPNWDGDRPVYDEVQFIKYGTPDAVQRALTQGEIDLNPAVEPAAFKGLGGGGDITAVKGLSPAITSLIFNSCDPKRCPDAKFNPAVQDTDIRYAMAYAIDRERLNRIAARNASVVANGILPQYYKVWYQKPRQSYSLDVEKARKTLDDAGWKLGSDGIRTKGKVKASFGMYARTEVPSSAQYARLIAEQVKRIGIDVKVQPVSADKLTELQARKQGGKPAPEYDTYVWGWVGDPYDPSLMLSVLQTDSADANYSNAKYDSLFDKQAATLNTKKRKAIIQQMLDIGQSDLPDLALTVDPTLEAYRNDRVEGLEVSYPRPDGSIVAGGIGFDGLIAAKPGAGGGGGSNAILYVAIAAGALILILLAIRIARGGGKGRGEREQMELET